MKKKFNLFSSATLALGALLLGAPSANAAATDHIDVSYYPNQSITQGGGQLLSYPNFPYGAGYYKTTCLNRYGSINRYGVYRINYNVTYYNGVAMFSNGSCQLLYVGSGNSHMSLPNV